MADLTFPKERYEKDGLTKNQLRHLIMKHRGDRLNELQKNLNYYEGTHAIGDREREGNAPNFKPLCNHAKDITDTASGYFMGNPITYNHDEKLNGLIEKFDLAKVDDTDQDNALNLSIFGEAYEYVYAGEGTNILKTKSLDPRHTFCVYDDTIEHEKLFGVYYDLRCDDVHDTFAYVATLCDDTAIYQYLLYQTSDYYYLDMDLEPVEHNLGQCPIIHYKNNKHAIGDFEQQIGLIDAYNELMADRVNDKAQFIDAVLVIYGAVLGDTQAESDEAMRDLKMRKLLEMPEGARAEYLTRTLDETSVETLRRAIKEDIYTMSHVPNLLDENFAGNTSGVAMEYKLLGLEMLTRTKERYYRKGLRKRIKMFCHYYGTLNGLEAKSDEITPVFARALPKNLVELSQIVSMLDGKVSQKTLIQQLPFVEDPDMEMKTVEEEQTRKVEKQMEYAQAQQEMLMGQAMNQPMRQAEEEVNE